MARGGRGHTARGRPTGVRRDDATRARVRDAVERHARVTFSRAGGPGGQNVNAVATQVQVRMPIARIPVSSRQRDLVRQRLSTRVTSDDHLRVVARRERHQAQNRALAVGRLVELVLDAVREDARRVPTAPAAGVQRRRRDERERLSRRKATRREPPPPD